MLINFTPRLTDYYSRCISKDTDTVKKLFPQQLVSYPHIKEQSYLKVSPSQLDYLADFTACSLRASLDSIAPVKKQNYSRD